ncbi:hypothetical protein E2K80_18560 [Rhodophyticola sp. CCM32]|uniref:hypothetical protein n=1 Tax=Rhodophyticola sp. CCM32 TaxID=2916397 RepID=UPI00107F5F30|nr:hypothetical protein [Rhodophyticola sp. CCM32]QBY02491.1 hypothetical protein E2K80_18560 [Rhodophyticola sp. CCM32]
MIKIVSLFLIGMVVLAMFGRLRLPRIGRRGGPTGGLPKPSLCPECGRYNLKGGPCRHCSKGQD